MWLILYYFSALGAPNFKYSLYPTIYPYSQQQKLKKKEKNLITDAYWDQGCVHTTETNDKYNEQNR